MKPIPRTFIRALAMMLLIIAGALSGAAQNSVQIGELYYNLDETNHTATVSMNLDQGYYDFENKVVIPESVTLNGNSYTVTAIGLAAFQETKFPGGLSLPSTLATIGVGAFESASIHQDNFALPSTMKTIDSGAFRECTIYTDVFTLPASITGLYSPYLDSDIFESMTLVNPNDDKGATIAIPGTFNTSLLAQYSGSDWASIFSSVKGIARIELGEGMTTIESYSFYNIGSSYTNPIEVSLPSTLKTIDSWAFAKSAITVASFPEGLEEISYDAFSETKLQGAIVIPSTVTTLKSGVFSDCTGITSVDIKAHLTELASNMFSGCTNLESVKIPSTVTSLGSITDDLGNTSGAVFSGCSSLRSINLPANLVHIYSETFKGCSSLTSIDIPSTVTEIGSSAFSGCTGLTSIDIPSTVTSIDMAAFSGCSNLTSVTLPSNLKTIKGYTFSGCTGLTSIVIPSTVTEIGSSAFSGCSSLTTLDVPEAVTEIDNDALPYTLKTVTLRANKVFDPLIFAFLRSWEELNTTPDITIFVPSSLLSQYRTLYNDKNRGSYYACHIYAIGTKPAAESITITPAQNVYYVGDTQQLTATVEPEGSISQLVWSSSDPQSATVSETGLVTMLNYGSTTISVAPADAGADSQVFASIYLRVYDKTKGLTLTPRYHEGTTAIVPGDVIYISPTFEPEDFCDPRLIWKSSDESVAKVNTEKGTGDVTVTAVGLGKAIISATTVDGTDITATVEINVVESVNRITVTAEDGYGKVAEGSTLQLNALVEPATATQKVVWSSADEKIATVDAETGLVTGVSEGYVSITATATDGSNISGSIVVNVIAEVPATGLTIDGEKDIVLYVGEESSFLRAKVEPLYATGNVVWSSSDEKIATVKAMADLDTYATITGVAKGEATVTATITNKDGSSFSASVNVTVKVPVDNIVIGGEGVAEGRVTMLTGTTLALTGTVEPEGAAAALAWSSSDPDVASVSEDGTVTAIKVGTATITATSTDGTDVTATIIVDVTQATESITIAEPENATVVVGNTLTLTATALPATASQIFAWTSSDEGIATVKDGVVTAVKPGTVTITARATDGTNKGSNEVAVTVIPAVASVTLTADDVTDGKVTMFAGDNLTVTATVVPADATQALEWSSDNEQVATVAAGVITAVAPGKAVVTARATDGSDKEATIEVTVIVATESITVTAPRESVVEGETLQLTAAALPEGASQSFEWSSSDNDKATVSDAGVVTGVAEGTVTITARATDGSGKEGSITLKVVPYVAATAVVIAPVEVEELLSGETLQLSASLEPADATGTVEWICSDLEAATVDAAGLVTALAKDAEVTITARITNRDGSVVVSEPVSLTIKAFKPVLATSLSLNGRTFYTFPGGTVSITATILPADVTTNKVAWSFSAGASPTGLKTTDLTAEFGVASPGRFTVTASTVDGTGLTASAEVICLSYSGIEGIDADPEDGKLSVEVYNLAGRIVARTLAELRALAPGFYIVNGRKVVIR